MQAPDRGMRIPCSLGAVPMKDIGQLARVFRKVGQIDRAILDEGHGLALLFHRHHDVETGFAHLGNLGLQPLVSDGDNAAEAIRLAAPVKAQITHPLCQQVKLCSVFRAAPFVELDQQQRLWSAAHELLYRLAKHRDLARQGDHR